MDFTGPQKEAEDRSGAAHSVRGSNQSGVRAHNERLVLTLIRQAGPLPKAEIARRSGLSAQTVSVIMRALEADGLLQKGAPVRGKVGQPSVPMSLVNDGAFFLGLKVGRRSLDLVLTDFEGNIQSREYLTHQYPTPDSVVQFANKAIEKLISDLPDAHQKRIAGLGIAIPFRLWDWAKPLGVRPEDMVAWRDRDVATEIAENWEFPVYLRNDASAACGAELVFGDKNLPRDFLYFFIGFFVGGGIVLDNTLFTGRSGNAAAFGPMPIPASGGQGRQLMDVASLIRLEKMVIDGGGPSQMIWDRPESWRLNEDVLEPWLEPAVDGLASAIFSSACVIDFESAVIDGWLPKSLRETIVSRTNAKLKSLNWAGLEMPEVREGTIGSDARALGAASLPLSDRFLIDKNALLKV